MCTLNRLFLADLKVYLRKLSLISLCFTWCLGYSCGFWLVSPAEPFSPSLMYALISQRGSILGLLAVNVLPFLITALFVRFRLCRLILPLAFLRAFISGYCNSCFLCAFASAGWLICLLVLFSQSCSEVLLLWYWIRNINYTGSIQRKECRSFLIASCVLSILAHYLLRPVGMDLIMES